MPVPSGSSSPATPSQLTALGFNDRWAAILATTAPHAHPARVVRDDRGAVLAVGEAGPIRLTVPRAMAPVTGDWLAVDDDSIVAVLERTAAITRPRHDTSEQVLAANVDLVGVTHSLERPLNHRRLERGIVLAYESGALPVVLLTKADLAEDAVAAAAEARAAAPGVDVIVVSIVDGRGLGQVRALVTPNATLALIGASGSGKSSLVNALVGDEALATAEVRSVDAKGRHTTSHRELVMLPGGGLMIDTPGLRALSIGVTEAGIDRAFAEVEELSPGCRFDDCSHVHEPGCAVKAAVADGRFAADRYDGWLRVLRESDSARLRADPILARQRGRQWGRMAREASRLKRDER